MHGIVFDDEAKVIKDLKNLCYDPVLRGKRFLSSNRKNLKSVTSNNIELMEVCSVNFTLTQCNLTNDSSQNFSQLLILLATGDE